MPGTLTLDGLEKLVRGGEIDTVLGTFPDQQGRLMGKRVTGSFFLDQVARDGMHACAYLLTVDVDMTPLPGYRMASWATGYQDFHAVPDWTTLRPIPWLEKTALVLCDLEDEHHRPIEASPRRILQRQVERAAKLGYRVYVASELEFFLFKDSYETARRKRYAGLQPIGYYAEDYHILQTTKEEFVHRDIRNGMLGAGVPVESSKGEWSAGQQEINLRYGEPVPTADDHVVYKNGAKEIAHAKGVSITFMAKYDMAQAGSFAPTRIAWALDNRTTGFRACGEGPSLRVENRIPGADANPYLAFAATIAAGLHGIEKKLKPPPLYHGNAYEDGALPQVPGSLREAVAALEKSKVAREAFGEEVYEHYLHTARLELEALDKVVTSWELERNFERI